MSSSTQMPGPTELAAVCRLLVDADSETEDTVLQVLKHLKTNEPRSVTYEQIGRLTMHVRYSRLILDAIASNLRDLEELLDSAEELVEGPRLTMLPPRFRHLEEEAVR